MNTKSKLEEATKRRIRAARLLQAGHPPAQVAAMVQAPRQTVYRWREVLESQGIDALRDMSKGGRPAPAIATCIFSIRGFLWLSTRYPEKQLKSRSI